VVNQNGSESTPSGTTPAAPTSQAKSVPDVHEFAAELQRELAAIAASAASQAASRARLEALITDFEAGTEKRKARARRIRRSGVTLSDWILVTATVAVGALSSLWASCWIALVQQKATLSTMCETCDPEGYETVERTVTMFNGVVAVSPWGVGLVMLFIGFLTWSKYRAQDE